MTLFTICTEGADYNKSETMDSDELQDACELLMKFWPNVTLNIEAVPS